MAESDVVRDAPERSRFELVRDERVIGFAEYERQDGVVTFTHTEVDAGLREHGLGSQLVDAALDQVAASGGRVVAQCPFVVEFIDEHPERQALLAD
jgi:uncharacterized protein